MSWGLSQQPLPIRVPQTSSLSTEQGTTRVLTHRLHLPLKCQTLVCSQEKIGQAGNSIPILQASKLGIQEEEHLVRLSLWE